MKILIIAASPQRFSAQLKLVKALKQCMQLSATFLFSHDVYAKYAQIARDNGFETALFKDKKVHKITSSKASKVLKRQVLSGLRKIIPRRLKNQIRQLRELSPVVLKRNESAYIANLEQQFKIAKSKLDEIAPNIIFSYGDRNLDIQPSLLKAAKLLKIPVLIPYLCNSSKRGPLLARQLNPGQNQKVGFFKPKKLRRLLQKYPNQVLEGYYFYSPHIIFSLHQFGTLSSDPWVDGSGLSDKLVLNSEHTKQRYVNYGINAEKIEVIGDVVNDRLYMVYSNKDSYRKAIVKQYELDGKKKIMIISLPQYAEHNFLDWTSHWKEIDFLVGTAAQKNKNVEILLSLHPKMDREQYKYLEDKFNCRILNESLCDALPLCDVFVSWEGSSTIYWSVLCGVNVVSFDFHQNNFEVNKGLSSPYSVYSHADFPDALEFVISSKIDFSSDWARIYRDEIFDGKVIEKYTHLIKKMVNERVSQSI